MPEAFVSWEKLVFAWLDQVAPARGLHRRNGPGVGIERLEWKGLFSRDANQEQAKCIGHSKYDLLQHDRSFSFCAFVLTGAARSDVS